MPRAPAACALAILLAASVASSPAAAQDADAPAEAPAAAPEAARKPAPKPRPKPAPRRAPKPEAQPAAREPGAGPAAPQPAPQPPALPLAAYVEAATTTIIAEQACPGIRLNAGQLTNLRLAARVVPAQEAPLEEQLRARAVEVRQQLAADGREAWCAAALDAFGPAGSVAKGVLTPTR